MSDIIDKGIVQADQHYIWRIGGFMLLVAAGGALCSIIASFLSARIAAGFGKNTRSRMFNHVENFTLHEFDKTVLTMMLRMMVGAPMMMIGGIIMAVSEDAKLSLIFVVVIPLLVGAIFFIGMKGLPLFKAIQVKLDKLNLVLREHLTGIRVIRSFNRINHENWRFSEANKDLTDTAIKVNKVMAGLMPLMMIVMNFSMIGILYFGGIRIGDGDLKVGSLMAFIQYAMQIMFSLIMVSMMFVLIPRASASAIRINEVLDMEPEIKDPTTADLKTTATATQKDGRDGMHGFVEFENVSFSYPGAEQPALSGITFSARPGEITAIIGGTGSGKSTLLSMIPRFYDAIGGSIRVDGVDVREMTQEDLRSKIGYIPQKAVLFTGTINENIRYGKDDATEEEIIHAAKVAQAFDFVSAMKDGFNSEIAQGGSNVSGGQKQRLSIARALVRKPEVYLFDDSFSALDFKTDAKLRAALKGETTDSTVLIVAQRVSTVMDADRIIVLDDGEIVGMGTHLVRGGNSMSEQNKGMKPPGGRPGGGGFGGGPGGPGMRLPAEKAKDFKGTLRRLIRYLRPRQVQLIIVFIMAIASTVFSIFSPKVMGKATTKLFEGAYGKLMGVPGAEIDFGYINNILIILAGLYLLSSLFSYIQQYVMAGVAQKVVYDMREQINRKLERLPLKYFDSRTHGEILSRATNDVDNISTTLQQSLTQLITSIVTIIGVIIMMLTISPWLTLITIVTLPLSFVVIMLITKRSQTYFIGQQKSLGQLNGHVEEMYTGHRIVKAFGREKNSLNDFNKINDDLYNSGWRAQFISGIIMPLMMFIGNLGYVLVCVVGGIFVTKKAIDVGDIQAFIQYSRQFTMPITQTANIANIIQSTIASAERVFELLDEEEEVAEVSTTLAKRAADAEEGSVEFRHVKFGYKEDAILIEDMNIEVSPGQTIAIVGPTGAGKTTLINLLMRFYEISGGEIIIDGVNITNMKRSELRSKFGMVLQDTWLFNGTIRDNIAYGREGATEADVVRAAKAAHADHFIRTLPLGYNTILNEEASNISQGQKQLLTIARAILADPSILILDEATSSVDTRTEVQIQKAMKTLMNGRTSFVIAHRLSTIRDADLILVMNQGSVIEKGTHLELLEAGGFYADLYNSQFSGDDLPDVG
ncbi:hypothetical protein KC345_g8695 [Hortaea werneckii]|nr:hypothetical protein KC345_g8695 [Hortaea werneckii]